MVILLARPAASLTPDGGAIYAASASGLAAQFTPIGELLAAQLAEQLYGIRGLATRFATEKDDTFRIDAVSGERYVLKVSNPDEARAELDLQVAVLRHIEQTAPTLPVPRVLCGPDGQNLVDLMVAPGEPRVARLYTYIHGIALDRLQTTAQQRYQIGEVLAQLRLAMASFAHPAAFRIIPWDVTHLLQLHPLIAEVDDPVHRTWIDEAFRRFARIQDALRQVPAQVLHNDFNRSNIVANPNGHRFVSGIIDFGDTVHTAIAIDVGTAVMNQFVLDFEAASSRDLFSEARDLLQGYLAHAPLSDEELRLVPHLAMARVAARALLSTWRAKLFPENEAYLLRFTRPGWSHLQWFIQHDHDAVSDALTSR